MSTGPVIVFGAGGHGKSVISVLRASGYSVSGVFDDHPSEQGEKCLGFSVSGFDNELLARPGLTGVVAVRAGRSIAYVLMGSGGVVLIDSGSQSSGVALISRS